VDADEIERPEPETVMTEIEPDLEHGTYTVTWRVISADSDPINGAFVFHVGKRGAQPAGIVDQVSEDTSGTVDFLYTAARFLDYAFLLLAAGGAIVLAIVLSMAASRVRRRLYLAVSAFAALLALAALSGLVLQGAKAGGLGLADALDWDVVSTVAETKFGEWALIRAVLAGALAVLAFVLSRRAGGMVGAISCIVLGLALLVTPALSGHASVAGKLAVVADYAHLVAGAAWTGGLAFLFAGLILAKSDRWSLASKAVPRFSNLAVLAVGLLLLGGVINGYLEVRTWPALWETDYGLLLSAKVLLVLPLLGLGAFNNRYAVPKLKNGTASSGERRRFLRAIGAELSIMVLIVGVTAVLVNASPAFKEYEMHGGMTEEAIELGPYEAHLTVDPGMPGPNEIMVDFGHGEAPDEVVVFASLPSEDIGPLRLPAEKDEMAEGAVFMVENADLSIPGDWDLRVEARKGEFDLYTHELTVAIATAME
jgi:copper transport protein